MRNLIIILALIVAALAGYFLIGKYLLKPIEPTTDAENQTATTTDEMVSGDEAALTGSKWSWVQTKLQNGEEVKAPTGDRFILSFEGEGRMGSRTDCNTIGGIYLLDGEVLSMGQFVMTKMACEGSLEMEYAEHLGLVNSYKIEGDTLTMNLNRDFGTMIFTKYESTN